MTADRTVTIDVNTKGLREAESQAKRANKELDKLERSRKAGSSGTGSRAADAALLSSGGVSTGIGRGTAAGNARGASRDFARQAQGLGGLVQLYATFAANIFAVSTAFNALSRSMDFALMTRAATIMSGTVGTSLNAMARQVNAITEGAVTLKDALSSVNLAASAGLNAKQITGLTKAAKGASLAMGRDMTDSLNRIFRGTVKIEPELLDELGIMVKVNDVNREYAKNLGKTATALTDFERRQAFVNGVLDQTNKKYGDLENLPANAFSQLSSSVINVLTTIGAGLTTTIAPFITALSQSPTALLAGLLAIVSLLVRQAIPAMKNYGAAQLDALETQARSYKVSLDHLEKNIAERKELLRQDTLNAKQAAAKTIDSVASLFAKGSKVRESFSSLLDLPADQLEKTLKHTANEITKQITATKTRLGSLQERRERVAGGEVGVTYGRSTFSTVEQVDAAIEKSTQHLKNLNEGFNQLQSSASNLGQAITAVNTQAALVLANDEKAIKLLKDKEGVTNQLRLATTRANAIALAENFSLRAAWRLINTEMIATGGILDKVGMSFHRLRARAGVLTAVLARALSALNIYMAIAAVGLPVLGALADKFGLTNDALSKNSKYLNDAKDSLDSYAEALKNVKKALNFDDFFTANVNALRVRKEAFDSLREAGVSYGEAMSKEGEGALSRQWERIKSTFGFGQDDDIRTILDKMLSNLSGNQLAALNEFSRKKGFKSFSKMEEEVLPDLSAPNSTIQATARAAFQTMMDEIEKVSGVSIETAVNLAKLGASEKILSDNAKDFIQGITTSKKEFQSMNEVFSSVASLAGTMGDTSLAARETGTRFLALGQQITNLSSSSVQAYSQLDNSQRDFINNLSTGIASIMKLNLSPKEKSIRLKELFDSQGGTVEVFKKVADISLLAAKNLYALGTAASRAKVQTANVNKADRVLSNLVSSIGGPASPEVVQLQLKFQDRLLEIQLASLNVQLKMLQKTAESDKEIFQLRLKAAGPIGLGLDASATPREVLNAVSLRIQELAKMPESSPREARRKEFEFSQVMPLFDLAAKALSSENMNKAAASELKSEKAVLETQKTTPIEKWLSTFDAISAGEARTHQLKAEARTRSLEIEDFNLSIQDATLGVTLLSTELNKLVKDTAQKKHALDITGAENLLTNLTDKQKKIEEELGKTKNKIPQEIDALKAASDQVAREIEQAKIKVKMLQRDSEHLTMAEKNQRDILIRNRFLESIEQFTTSLSSAADFILKYVDHLVSNHPRENKKALASLNNLSPLLKEQAAALEIDKEKRLQPIKDRLKNTQVPHDIYALRQEIFDVELKTANALYEIYEKQLLIYKQRRSLEMKEAESYNGSITDTFAKIFSRSNMEYAGEIFVTALDDKIKNIPSTMEQAAIGLADSIDKSVDLFMDLLKQSKNMTGKEFIGALGSGIRNILAESVASMASNTLKQALYGGIRGAVNKLFGIEIKTDAEKQADALINSQRGLKEAIVNLTTAFDNYVKSFNREGVVKAEAAADKADKLYPYVDPNAKPLRVDKLYPSAQLFPYVDPNAKPISETTLLPPAYLEAVSKEEREFNRAMGVDQERLYREEIELEERMRVAELNYINKLNQADWPESVKLQLSPALAPQKGLPFFNQALDKYYKYRGDPGMYGYLPSQSTPTGIIQIEGDPIQAEFGKMLQDSTSGNILREVDPIQNGFDKMLQDSTSGLDKMDTSVVGVTENLSRLSLVLENRASTAASEAATATPLQGIGASASSTGVFPQKEQDKVEQQIARGLGSSISGGIRTALQGDSIISNVFANTLGIFMNAAITKAVMLAFAEKGGVIGPKGVYNLPTHAYAQGGIATSPQLAIFGEGSQNEAFVPLPDNRSIPVTLKGSSGGITMGDTSIQVNVSVQKDGTTETKSNVDVASEFGKQLSAAVKQTVQAELIKQRKPGGLLYR